MTQEKNNEIVTQEIPDGFKWTEIGVLPKSWRVKSIGELANVSSGGTPNRKTPEFWNGDIPWVTTTLINGGEITHATQFITQKGLDNSSAKMCRSGTILMAMYGQGKTRGKVGVLSFDASINQACAAIFLTDISSSEYILHILSSMYDEIRDLSNAGGQENLSSGIIKKITIPFPSPKEQTAIANALTDVDSLLSVLEKLIAKKQAIKTATMQQLLTGKTRLPSFATYDEDAPKGKRTGQLKGTKSSELGEIPEDWGIKTFGQVMSIRHGKDQKSVQVSDGQYPIFGTGGQMGTTNTSLYDKPSVLIGRKGTINKPRFIDSPFWTVDTLFYSEIFSKESAKFIYYKFCMIDWMQYNEASGVPSLNARTIENVLASFPKLKEQTAIATVLSDIDEEIQALEQRLSKTRQIKQGMMQELLTGKTRLPFDKN